MADTQPGTGTSWAEILCGHAMVLMDDLRWQEELERNPARFLREKSLYMKLAIPRFNRPAEIISYLTAHSTEPRYSDFLWTVPDEIGAAPVEVDTGQLNYELCSVVIRSQDVFGNPVETPYRGAVYHPESGIVSFPADVEAGTVFDMDFYTDGQFGYELTAEMKRILALCVQVVWENRFSSEWLTRSAKVQDKSFSIPNEANWTRAQEEKRKSLEASLNSELRQYEQNCYYRSTIQTSVVTLL